MILKGKQLVAQRAALSILCWYAMSLLMCGQVIASEADTAKKTDVHLKLKSGGRLSGTLVSLEENEVTLLIRGKEKSVSLDDLEPVSVYIVRRATIDSDDANAHLDLGRYLWVNGRKGLAIRELNLAKKLDSSLAERIAEIRKLPSKETKSPAHNDESGRASSRGNSGPDFKFIPTTPVEIAANRKKAEEWGEKTRETVTSKMHLIETEHFLIYSAWDKSNDTALAKFCEKMYRALCKQFAIPSDQSIWAGKLPIYIFWEEKHYSRFCKEVDGAARRSPKLLEAAGYNSHSGSFTYVVCNKVRDKTWFYEIMVHEVTHAFLARYLTNRHILSWVNEGIADYMAATLVRDSWAKRKYVDATKKAIKQNLDVSSVFREIRPNSFDYGIAQSLVRYLIKRNRKAFIKFVAYIKEGMSDGEALDKAYGLTHEELQLNWRKAVKRKP